MKVVQATALNTWRLAWREPLTRLELGMLALLTLLAAIATVGSPTAGSGAIQMYAVAYAVVPFALVLIVGQLSRDPEEETAWWSRPLSRDQVLMGRFLGYVSIGVAMVLLMAAWGWGLMTLIAHLNAWDGALWTMQFALFTMPSVVTVAGASLWLVVRLPGRTRYFAPAIIASLVIAFSEYKISVFLPRLPHLAFFNPFPGFLELGLALPPSLIAPPGISGWLWLNRLVWGLLGLLLLLFAIRRRHGRYPLRHRKFTRNLAILAAMGILTGMVFLQQNATRLSPAVTNSRKVALTPSCRQSHVRLAVNASDGAVRGTITCKPPNTGIVRFVMNAGFAVESAREDGRTLHAISSKVLRGTALRQWTLTGQRSAAALSLIIHGQPLPRPSTLPYPPFAVGQVYSGLYAGDGRVYMAHAGRDLPSFLPSTSPVTLTVTHLEGGAIVTTAVKHRTANTWGGTLGNLVVISGPLTKKTRGPTTIWLVVPGGARLPAFFPYVGSLRNLEGWLPIPKHIAFVPSPVTTGTQWDAPLILYSDVHPFAQPRDPIAETTSPPTSYTATLTLSRLFWSAAPPKADTPQNMVLTALLIFSHSNGANLQLLLTQLRQRQVTGVGSLNKRQVKTTLAQWRVLHRESRRRQKVWIHAAYRGR
ncbi:MAG: hypothetical protein M0Z36_08775 [Thermaerobacter sp.]|nr:hypothetical protein [Thermaerobacter sp.]